MNAERLRYHLTELAEEVNSADLHDRVLTSSRRLAARRAAVSGAMAVVLVVALGGFAYALVPQVGAPVSPMVRSSAAVDGPRIISIAPDQVRLYDPQGPGHEATGVARVVDGDVSTGWTSDRYNRDPMFGGLKEGIGLVIDLKTFRSVSSVRVTLGDPGASARMLALAEPPELIQDGDPPAVRRHFTLIGQSYQRHDGATMDFVAASGAGTECRFLLFWIFELPPVGSTGRYQARVQELTVTAV